MKTNVLSEALEKACEMVDIADSFADDISSDLENLIADMARYDDGDDKETLLDGIANFISATEDILMKIK